MNFLGNDSFGAGVSLLLLVGYMINVPMTMKHRALSPQHVALHLNRAGSFYAIGIRVIWHVENRTGCPIRDRHHLSVRKYQYVVSTA